ncbi:hypothetical protein EJ08DRAFT_661969 [Tothia fuscella]|uniref:Uncharacterized protein n=1 Tax=Tothia fuscella TaxID=1048955 RepID=A0A9P4NPF5_9PEZI|nr:hypothetical protein EJ08DRAFT_661969 [Tothia fuscella]
MTTLHASKIQAQTETRNKINSAIMTHNKSGKQMAATPPDFFLVTNTDDELFPFLKLPAEIRNKVYVACLTQCPPSTTDVFSKNAKQAPENYNGWEGWNQRDPHDYPVGSYALFTLNCHGYNSQVYGDFKLVD